LALGGFSYKSLYFCATLQLQNSPVGCATELFKPGLRSRRIFGGIRFLTTLGVKFGFFCPALTPDVQLDHSLHHTLKLGISVEMVQFLLDLLLKQISCCAPRFPLILTAKFHSLHVKESEILERSELESDILPPTLQPWFKPSKDMVSSYFAMKKFGGVRFFVGDVRSGIGLGHFS